MLKVNPSLIMHKDGDGKKSAISDYHKYIYWFLYKGNMLSEPHGSVERSLETTAIDSTVLFGHSEVNLVVVVPRRLPLHQQC
jgi:hypothetical protein